MGSHGTALQETAEARISGVVPRRSKAPPPIPTTAVMPPPLPTKTLPDKALESRVGELEHDLGFMLEATDRRISAIEERQRLIVGRIGELQERIECIEAWALRVRDTIEGLRGSMDAQQLEALDGKLRALDSRVSLELEAMSERVDDATSIPPPAPSTTADLLASQLDALLGQVSMWKAEHDALKARVDRVL
ncbi:MAG: hypothetical protein AAGE52_17870 [Myxococcota bacterium]